MAEAVKTDFWVVSPYIPTDGQHLQCSGPTNGYGYGQVLIGGFTFAQAPLEYFTFKGTRDEAHSYAANLASQYNKKYFVSKLVVEGCYNPPPPEFVSYVSYKDEPSVSGTLTFTRGVNE